MSASHTGVKLSTGHCASLRHAALVRGARPPNMAGIPLSAEHREKIAAAHRGTRGTEEGKRKKAAWWSSLTKDQQGDLSKRRWAASRASRGAGPSCLEKSIAKTLDSLHVPYESEYRIGRFLVDFAIPSLNLAIEADGEYWHKNRQDYDAARDDEIGQAGYRVYRFSEQDIVRGRADVAIREIISLGE